MYFHVFACSLQGHCDLLVLNARDEALLQRFLRILISLTVQHKVSLCLFPCESDGSPYLQSSPLLAWPRASQGLPLYLIQFIYISHVSL